MSQHRLPAHKKKQGSRKLYYRVGGNSKIVVLMKILVVVLVLLVIIILRLLRSKYKWVDDMMAYLTVGLPIILWIIYDFWIALISFGVLYGVFYLVFGQDKKVDIDGCEYDIECNKCKYNHTEVVSRTVLENGNVEIEYRCPRCGYSDSWIFYELDKKTGTK